MHRNHSHSTHQGGKHRPAIGYSTLDGETDEERVEHLRRLHYEFGERLDEPAVRACYAKQEPAPQPEKPSILAQYLEFVREQGTADVAW